jgi:hypothetical protein
MAVKERSTASDVVWLLVWLLTHYTDEGRLRSPQAPRRRRLVLDGVTYVLVRLDEP